MDDIFIDNSSAKQAPKARKTKKEVSQEEYLKVCERMAELRNKRKNKLSGNLEPKPEPEPEKSAKPTKSKPEVRYKEVIKYVDRPVEVIKEVQVPAKDEPSKPVRKVNLFDDTEVDAIKSELSEVKSLLSEMKQRKLEKDKQKQERQQQQQPSTQDKQPQKEPVKQQEPIQKQEPVKQTRTIYPPLFRPF